ncbi:outer membrane lipoprotein-sorting protein [Natronospirillum operosum]|nr:outer membrane lipoprotein-sorting protein [Natronospirillum operosum]
MIILTTRLMLVLLLAALMATVLSAQAETPEARDIMTQVDNRYTGDSSHAEAQLILIDRRERERVRDLVMYELEAEGTSKSIVFFRSPADVAGTSYLSHDHDGADNDAWLYLPALGQVRRVAAGDRAGAFMGSDFSYSDMDGMEIDWWQYRLLDDSQTVNDHPVWHLEAVPHPDHADQVLEETGYERARIWVRQDNLVLIRGQYWLADSDRSKYFSASELTEIDGIWTPLRLQMVTTRNGEREHSSVLSISHIEYNSHSDADLFTTRAMERGLE